MCSCYYFPIALNILPSLNSKMVLAALGLVVFIIDHAKRRKPTIRRDVFPVILMGLIFSLSSYFSVVYNNTDDMVFATYFVSMCVWLGGAYFVTFVIRKFYGSVTFEDLFFCLALTCAGQCILAVLINNSSELAYWVDSVFNQTKKEYFDENPRLYGIGASFDTAGIRFSCVLLGMAYLIKKTNSYKNRNIYIILLLIIGGIGNMISRTTVVGIAMFFVYLLLSSKFLLNLKVTLKSITWRFSLCLLLVLVFYLCKYSFDL